MSKTKGLAGQGGKTGNFADQRNDLLAHFDGRAEEGARSWRQTFGYERRPEQPKGGNPFIARAARRSSSDS